MHRRMLLLKSMQDLEGIRSCGSLYYLIFGYSLETLNLFYVQFCAFQTYFTGIGRSDSAGEAKQRLPHGAFRKAIHAACWMSSLPSGAMFI